MEELYARLIKYLRSLQELNKQMERDLMEIAKRITLYDILRALKQQADVHPQLRDGCFFDMYTDGEHIVIVGTDVRVIGGRVIACGRDVTAGEVVRVVEKPGVVVVYLKPTQR